MFSFVLNLYVLFTFVFEFWINSIDHLFASRFAGLTANENKNMLIAHQVPPSSNHIFIVQLQQTFLLAFQRFFKNCFPLNFFFIHKWEPVIVIFIRLKNDNDLPYFYFFSLRVRGRQLDNRQIMCTCNKASSYNPIYYLVFS